MSIINSIIWDVSPELFSLGGITIRWYGFLFALGFFLAYLSLYHIFKKEKIEVKLLDKLTLYIFIATIVGARLGHVFFYEWNYYKDNLVEILFVWKGGLASHGAGIAIIIALIIFYRYYKLNPWWLFDRISVVIPVSAAFVRFGNLMNSEIYGKPTDVPWGFVFKRGSEQLADGRILNDVACHPTQLYEAFSYLFIFALLFILWKKSKGIVRPGLFVGIFLILLFTARFLIEFLKIPQEKFENTTALDMGQWLSIPFILLGIFFLVKALRKKNTGEAESGVSGTN